MPGFPPDLRFVTLQPAIITFEELGHQFMSSRKRRRSATYLFNKEQMTTDELDEKITLAALVGFI